MTNKKIEERCNFKTQRLLVSSWTNQVKELDSEKNFAEKVIEILTPNVTKALPNGWQNISTIEGAQEWIKNRDKESHFVTIQLLSTNETIGFIFLYETDSGNNYHDLRFGYLLSEKVWGKGLGTELIEGLIRWCKIEGDIKSISGGVETDNIGSIKVLEKTGFSVSTVDNPTEEVVFYEYQFDIEEVNKAVLLAMSEEEFEKEIGFTVEKWHQIKNDLSKRETNISAKLNCKAPDFIAISLSKNGQITNETKSLSDYNGNVLALIFGSYTCPVFRAHNNRINEIYESYKDKVSFLHIYVYEMHPKDGWFIPVNLKDNVVYNQPKSNIERAAIAKDWIKNKNIKMPVAIDDTNNTIDSLYAGSPERLYVIDRNSMIRFRSSVGPFEDKEVEEWESILKELIK